MSDNKLSDENDNGLDEMYARRKKFLEEHPNFSKNTRKGISVYMCEFKIRREVIAAEEEGREPNLTEVLEKIHYDGESSFIIHQNETVIKTGRFSQCWGLRSVTLPHSIKRIEDGAFEHCPALTSIVYEGTMAEWNSIEKGEHWDDNDIERVHCADGDVIRVLRLPNGVTEIGEGQYCGMDSLLEIILPDSLQKIGDGSFCDCPNLKKVYFGGGETEIGDNVFGGTTQLDWPYSMFTQGTVQVHSDKIRM